MGHPCPVTFPWSRKVQIQAARTTLGMNALKRFPVVKEEIGQVIIGIDYPAITRAKDLLTFKAPQTRVPFSRPFEIQFHLTRNE